MSSLFLLSSLSLPFLSSSLRLVSVPSTYIGPPSPAPPTPPPALCSVSLLPCPRPRLQPPPSPSLLLPPSPAPPGGGDLPVVPPIAGNYTALLEDDHRVTMDYCFAAGPAPPAAPPLRPPLVDSPSPPRVWPLPPPARHARRPSAPALRGAALARVRPAAGRTERQGEDRTPRGRGESRGLATRAITIIIVLFVVVFVACCVCFR
jgi:hypothetical protein